MKCKDIKIKECENGKNIEICYTGLVASLSKVQPKATY